MGAPGFGYVCEKGHLYHWYEERMVWDEDLFEHAEFVKTQGCICGAKHAETIGHYGAIDDCEPWVYDGSEKILIPFKGGLFTKEGKKIEHDYYHYLTLQKVKKQEGGETDER